MRRQLNLRRALFVGTAAALCAAGVGGAKALSDRSVDAKLAHTTSCRYLGDIRSTRVFFDPTADSDSPPDIRSVAVLERCNGYVGFKVTSTGPFEESEDEVLVAIDLDQNPDTGSAYYGTDVEVALAGIGSARGDRPKFYRAHGWDFRGTGAKRPRWGFPLELGPHYVTFYVKRAALGLRANAGFNVVAASIGRHPDTAPNDGTFNYQRIAGRRPPPRLGADRRAPKLFAYDSSGVHGRVAKLDYWVLEGRGRTRQMIRIYRGRRVMRTIWTSLADASPFGSSATTWKVPPRVHGALRYCVRSFDAAGNRSSRVCAGLQVR